MGNKQTRTTVYDSVPQETRGEGGNEIPYETLREDETINIGNICVLWGVLKGVMDEKDAALGKMQADSAAELDGVKSQMAKLSAECFLCSYVLVTEFPSNFLYSSSLESVKDFQFSNRSCC